MSTHPSHIPVSNTGVPSTTQPNSSGRRFGEKVRGVFQVVHGFGENIRGTFLGAFDTMTHETSGRNDQIAREGRLEIQRGMERLGRGTGNATTGTATTGMTTTNAPSYPNTYNEPQAAANDSMFRRPAAAYKAEVPTDAPVAPGPAGYSTGASYGYPHGHDKAPHL